MVPTSFRVLLDANVIYPLCLRDVLLWSAAAEHYRVLWSERILEEATRNLVEHGRITEEQATRLLNVLRREFPEAMITDYEGLVDAMPNAQHDRHVVAAAVRGGAQVIVTQNLRDFAPLPAGIAAQHPDDFLCYLFDLFGDGMLAQLESQVSAHKRPPRTLVELLDALAVVVPEFVAAARTLLQNRP